MTFARSFQCAKSSHLQSLELHREGITISCTLQMRKQIQKEGLSYETSSGHSQESRPAFLIPNPNCLFYHITCSQTFSATFGKGLRGTCLSSLTQDVSEGSLKPVFSNCGSWHVNRSWNSLFSKKKRKKWNAIISESIRCIQDKYCFMKVFQFFSGQNVKAIGVPKSENSCLSVSCSQGCSVCSAAAPTS